MERIRDERERAELLANETTDSRSYERAEGGNRRERRRLAKINRKIAKLDAKIEAAEQREYEVFAQLPRDREGGAS